MEPYELFPGIITAEQAAHFATAVMNAACVRASLQGGRVSWSEYEFGEDSELWTRLLSDRLLRSLKSRGVSTKGCYGWINLYRKGEFIDWHTDIEGTLQLICVLAAPSAPEGQLNVKIENAIYEVPARAGDAVLFNASKTLHRTTPIASPGVFRMTAAIRFPS